MAALFSFAYLNKDMQMVLISPQVRALLRIQAEPRPEVPFETKVQDMLRNRPDRPGNIPSKRSPVLVGLFVALTCHKVQLLQARRDGARC